MSSTAQAKKSPAKKKKQKMQYTWNGKVVTYKQCRDSLQVVIFQFCDSLQKAEEDNRKLKVGREQN